MGRPTKIDQVVATVEGRPVTAADRIVQSLRIGDYLETAAAAVGVGKETVYGWLRTGADATAREHRGTALGRKVKLTAHEQRCQQFSDAVATATAYWHQQTLTTLEGLARGGQQVRTTTTKTTAILTEDGREATEVVVTERVETLAPDVRVLLWRLERRFPDRYSRRLDVHLGGDEYDPDEEQAGKLADELAAFQAGADAQRQALEVRGSEKT